MKYQEEDINQKSKKVLWKILNRFREAVIKLFNNYSPILSKAKYKSIHGKGLKKLTPKQIFQRLPIALAQVNEIRQIIYSLYRAKEITTKVYNNIMNSIEL